MSTAFVTYENPDLDLSPADKWVDSIVLIFPERVSQITLQPQTALARVRKVLSTMTRDDYLILLGDPVMMGMVTAVAAELLGKVKILRFDRREFKYIPVEIDFVSRTPLDEPTVMKLNP